jgi:hypothetical protein
MKHLRETFTDQEFVPLQRVKEASGLNWHDFFLLYTGIKQDIVYYTQAESNTVLKGLFNGLFLQTPENIHVNDILKIDDKTFKVLTRKEQMIARQFSHYVCKLEEVKTE